MFRAGSHCPIGKFQWVAKGWITMHSRDVKRLVFVVKAGKLCQLVEQEIAVVDLFWLLHQRP